MSLGDSLRPTLAKGAALAAPKIISDADLSSSPASLVYKGISARRSRQTSTEYSRGSTATGATREVNLLANAMAVFSGMA